MNETNNYKREREREGGKEGERRGRKGREGNGGGGRERETQK